IALRVLSLPKLLESKCPKKAIFLRLLSRPCTRDTARSLGPVATCWCSRTGTLKCSATLFSIKRQSAYAQRRRPHRIRVPDIPKMRVQQFDLAKPACRDSVSPDLHPTSEFRIQECNDLGMYST